MKERAKQFIQQFEIVFHTDWSFSSAMLCEETFRDNNRNGETFIKSEPMTNWCNRDSLLDNFKKIKIILSKNNVTEYKITETLNRFILDFEKVFDKDWGYTKTNMNIEITDQQEAHAKEFGLEVIYVISNKGTFLHPELTDDELDLANWGNRDLLLKYYKEMEGIL